jgi:enamine deaminase RidA (YjgF/YER057c/UK114 family)
MCLMLSLTGINFVGRNEAQKAQKKNGNRKKPTPSFGFASFAPFCNYLNDCSAKGKELRMSIEARIKEFALTLPPAPPAGGIYSPMVITGNLVFISGQPPARADGSLIKGKVGMDLSLEEGQLAAKQTGLTMLATLKRDLGSLDRIGRLIKSLGMVNCLSDFEEHPQVINGYSQLMVDILGDDKGKGARSAVGMTLPGNIAVEIEAIFELSA